MKVCTSCGIEKNLSEYGKAVTCADGTRSYCKACHKLRKDAWRHKNREHHNKKCRDWAAKNQSKNREIKRRCSNKRTIEGKSATSKRAWWTKNRDKCLGALRKRRIALRLATPAWVDLEEIKSVYEKAASAGLTVDHIVPVNHAVVCGLHVPWNLQIISRSENSRKGNKYEIG